MPTLSQGGRLAGLCLATLLLGISLPHDAAAQADAATSAARAQIFQQLLNDPTNAALTLRYADTSAKLGDIESAISALERLLLSDPDLPNVRVQLGLLYLQLGSYDMARAYLEPVAESDTAPAADRSEAAQSLTLVDQLSSRHQFSGNLFFGVQTQTDPGGNPGSANYLVSGQNQVLGNQFARHHDSDVFGQGSGAYAYDLGNSHNDKIEADSFGYSSFFKSQRSLDLVDVKLVAGPRFGLDRIDLDEGSLKPYALGEYVGLGQQTYYRGYGAGLEYVQRLNASGTQLTVDYEGEQENFHTSNYYPTARLLSGRLDHVAIGIVQPIGIGIGSAFGIAAIVNRENTAAAFYTNTDVALAPTLTLGYDVGPLSFGYPWVSSLGFIVHYIGYDAADPSVSATTRRQDWRTQYALTQIVPVTQSVSLVGQAYRDANYSNVRNYSYGNTSFLIGAQINF